jgi:uncharacterized membrane protein YqiK
MWMAAMQTIVQYSAARLFLLALLAVALVVGVLLVISPELFGIAAPGSAVQVNAGRNWG